MEDHERIYKVIVDSSANNRMYEHYEFLARTSPSAADRLLDSLAADIESLEQLPFRNPKYNRPYLPEGKYRYMISNERYRIVYQIDGDFIFVDDIQDCRQANERNII